MEQSKLSRQLGTGKQWGSRRQEKDYCPLSGVSKQQLLLSRYHVATGSETGTVVLSEDCHLSKQFWSRESLSQPPTWPVQIAKSYLTLGLDI